MAELGADSPAGAAALTIAEHHAGVLAERPAERDRKAAFDPAYVDGFRTDGLAAAAVPRRLGGGGLTIPSEQMAVSSRLGRGDGSAALVWNMHSGLCSSLTAMTAAPHLAEQAETLLSGVVDGSVWMSAAVTESGTNYFNPAATLDTTGGDRRLVGMKVFATGSPAATHLMTNVRIVGGENDGRLASVLVPAALDGVVVHDDWDGLGMRSSGSGRVEFDTSLPADTIVAPGGPAGELSGVALAGRALGNLKNLAAILGVAEAAAELAVERVRRGERAGSLADRPTVRIALAEMLVARDTGRAVLAELGREADSFVSAEAGDALALMATFQTAKLALHRQLVTVGERSMDLAGGGGYTSRHPAGRLYRDLRAGPYMQPFSPHEALGFIGSVAAEVEPDPAA